MVSELAWSGERADHWRPAGKVGADGPTVAAPHEARRHCCGRCDRWLRSDMSWRVCDGLVLAKDLVALCALPSFDTSAMDGWAVAGPGPWTIVGQSLAGRPVPGPLTAGQAVVIATGGVVPGGADAVVRSEDGEIRERSGAQVLSATAPGGPTHVRPAGEECVRGEVLASAGTVLTPALIGLAAASGHDQLLVVPAPRVALVLFGDELATSGVPVEGAGARLIGPAGAGVGGSYGGGRGARGALRGPLAADVEAIRARLRSPMWS